MSVRGNEECLLPEEERQAWVRRFRGSGLSLRQFAERHGLKPTRLHYWVYQRGAEARPGGWVGAPHFQEVALPAGLSGTRWGLEVQGSKGSIIRVAAGVDPAWVGAVVSHVGGIC